MDQAKRFEEATAYATVNISNLQTNILYRIVGARRMITKYRPTVLFSIRDSESRIVQLFLPKIYYAVISHADMDKNNTKRVSLNLVI